jgi:eukaryotic-like serine/threonine-protein kinase
MVAQHARDLAVRLNNLSMVLQKQHRSRQAADVASEGIQVQESLMKACNQTNDAASLCRVGAMRHNLATSLIDLNELAAAEKQLLAAIDTQEAALTADPSAIEPKSFLVQHYSSLLKCQARSKRWRDMDSTAFAYRKIASNSPESQALVADDLAEVSRLKKMDLGKILSP